MNKTKAKLSFLDVLIDTNNNNDNNFATSTCKKKTPRTNPVPSNLSQCPVWYKNKRSNY